MDVIIIDPTANADLAELADLSGATWQRVRSWPFEFPASSRVVSTVPVPNSARQDVLGVVVGQGREPGLGEGWPVRCVPVQDQAEILAFLAGTQAPQRPRVGFLGARGGLGTSMLTLAVALRLEEVPTSVAVVDQDPFSRAPELLGIPDAWSRLRGQGPLLPSRVSAAVPQWSRAVRVAAGRCPGVQEARAVAAALSRAHDVTLEDRGRMGGQEWWEGLSAAVFLMRADDDDLRQWHALPAGVPVVPVLRQGWLSAADAADYLGRPVIVLETERRRDSPPTALLPGQRARGALARAAREVVRELREVLW